MVQRQNRTALSFTLRETFSEEFIAWYMREVICGRDPNAERDAEGRIVGPHLNPPDAKRQDQMFRTMLNRRDGLPAQKITIDQEIRGAIGVMTMDVSSHAIAAMAPEKRAQLRELLREAVGTAAAPRRAIDVGRDAAVQAMIDQARAQEEDDE